ncbi:MAG TPA: cadherin-like beta sandwich domain-containing protein [Lachnospiraceae bacterium]|nr:cadherin-like beta sandwich domain-containing protein [Lachnospiraceae bacterium]
MKRRKTILAYLLLLCLGSGLFMQSKVAYAASATVSLSTDASDIKLKDTFEVILLVEADAEIGGFETYLSYDDTLIEFVEGGSCVTGGEGILKVNDMNPENIVTSRKYVLQFKAIDQGNMEIKVMDQAHVYAYDDSAEMSVSSNRLSISIAPNKTSSNNANLKSLKISPGTLSPEFSADVTKYSTEVSEQTKNIVISAVTQDAVAKVKTKGGNDLKAGENTVDVVVTAQSGDKKKYTITVNKLGEDTKNEETQDTEVTEDVGNNDTKESGGEVVNAYLENGSTFVQNSNKYQIAKLEDDTLIPVGYKETSLLLNDISVTAYELENGSDSDFLLIYATNESGESGFYQFDRTEKTIQRYKPLETSDSSTITKTVTDEGDTQKMNNFRLAIAILTGITILSILIIIRLVIKLRGYRDDDFM